MRVVAWIGAALFAGSLGYFAYFYAVVLGRVAEAAPGGSVAAVAWNITLFSAFALHHSVLARTGAKAWLTRLIPPRLERSGYVWVASLLFLAVCWLWRPLPGLVWDVHGPWRAVLYAVQLTGIVLTLRSAALINVWDLAGVAQVRPATHQGTPQEQAAVFKTDGPYGWLRHPIYLGWVLIVFGTPTMTASRALFAAISTLYLVIAIPLEERSLVREHGDGYRQYQRLVRWRLIPGLW
jgi:protein-S-isoprenylcysteine O-methyltransferase Ste14